ncbi:MAG: hypothetical protein NVSMB47_04280 [Polyangiales bacterium]
MSQQAAPEPSSALDARIRAAIGAAPRPPAARLGTRLSIGIGVAVLATLAVAAKMRPDAPQIPASAFFATVGASLLLAIAAVGVSALPGRRGLGAPVTLLVGAACAVPVLYALITALWPMHASGLALPEPALADAMRGAIPCVLTSIGVAGLAFLGLAWALRRAVPVAAALRGAALGAAAGAWSGLAMHLHCPHFDRAHVLIGHVAPIVLFAIVGAVVGPRMVRT